MSLLTALPSAQTALAVLLALFLYTWRNSLPLSWTLRIIYINLRARYLASAPSSSSSSPPSKVTLSSPHLLLSRLPPPGTDIFAETFTSTTYTATIDECDFNGHLSNSSYAKRLDFARSEFAAQRFLRGAMDGAWVALGGTSFRYHKEIPMGGEYRVRMRIVGWDEKWAYLEAKYISTNRKTRTEMLNCTALAKLCVKSGRKTIPPWLFFSLCGYAPSSSPHPSRNWTRAEALRVELLTQAREKAKGKGKALRRDSWLQGGGYGKAAGILTAYVPVGKEGVALGVGEQPERPEWMEKSYWDVEGWEKSRVEGMEELAGLALSAC